MFEGAEAPGDWPENDNGWTVERLDWEDPTNQDRRRTRQPSAGARWLQGTASVTGHLIPACLEVFDWLRGTPWWPNLDGAVLALETSEEQPSPEAVVRMLRPLVASGEIARLSALLLGRPGGHELDPRDHTKYDDAVITVIRDEASRPDMPIVTGLDFGHTDPPWTLPVGVVCTVAPSVRRISFDEPCVSARVRD